MRPRKGSIQATKASSGEPADAKWHHYPIIEAVVASPTIRTGFLDMHSDCRRFCRQYQLLCGVVGWKAVVESCCFCYSTPLHNTPQYCLEKFCKTFMRGFDSHPRLQSFLASLSFQQIGLFATSATPAQTDEIWAHFGLTDPLLFSITSSLACHYLYSIDRMNGVAAKEPTKSVARGHDRLVLSSFSDADYRGTETPSECRCGA